MASHPFEQFPAEIWMCIAEPATEFEQKMMNLVFSRSQYLFPAVAFKGGDEGWKLHLDSLMKHDRCTMPCMNCGETHRISGPVRCYHRPVCEEGKSSWQPFPQPNGFDISVPRIQHNLLRALQWLSTSGCRTKDFGAVKDLLARVNKRIDEDVRASISSDGPPIHVRLAVWNEEILAEVWTERIILAGDNDEENRKLIDTGRGYLWVCCADAKIERELFHGCYRLCPPRVILGVWGAMQCYRPFDCGRACQPIPKLHEAPKQYPDGDCRGWGSRYVESLTSKADEAVVEGIETADGVRQIRTRAHNTCPQCRAVHYMDVTETMGGEHKIRTGFIRSTDNDVMVIGDKELFRKNRRIEDWPQYHLFRNGWWGPHRWGTRRIDHWHKLYDKSLDPAKMEE